MRNKLVPFLSLALLVSGIPQHLSADNDSVKKFVAPEGFTFELPTGWKRLPSETLAAYEKLAGDAMPNVPRRKMAYAFHLDERMDVIGQPRIIITINNGGRLDDKDAKKSADRLNETLQKKADESFKDNKQGMSAGILSASYDETNHVLIVDSLLQTEEFGPVRGRNATFLTERGTVVFGLSSKDAEHEIYEQVFKGILNSVRFESGVIYQPRKSRALTPPPQPTSAK